MMLGQYILHQLNQLRCHQVYCDLELVSSDKVVFNLHQVVFTALNKRHFNLAIENAEAGMYDVVSKKKMILSCLDSGELKLLIDFMYGITVTEEDSNSRLVSALKKLHMEDLLQNSDCSYPQQSVSSLPTQSRSCQTDGSMTGVNSYTVQNQHLQPDVSPRAVVEKSGSLNCGHNKILEVDQIKVEDTDQRPVSVDESSAANLSLEANTVEKMAPDENDDRQNNVQNAADTGHSVGISVIHRQNTENEVNLSNFFLPRSTKDQLKSNFGNLVCGNGSKPYSVQKEGKYCQQKGTTLDPVNCDGKGYQNQRMNIDIKQEPVENENMFTCATGLGIGLNESGKEPTRDESMGLEATRTSHSEPSHNTVTERNVREEPLLDPYGETDWDKSFTTPSVNISLPAKHVEVLKKESHTDPKSDGNGEVSCQNNSLSTRTEKHSVKGKGKSMQSILSPKQFAVNVQTQNLDMWRKPHQRRRSVEASVNDSNAPSQSAVENGTKNDERLLCDSGRDEQKLSSNKPAVSNLNCMKETKTVCENQQNEPCVVTTHVPVSEILTVASADNVTTDASTAQSVCTKVTGSLQCKLVQEEEQSLKQDKRSNVKNAGAQNISDKKKIMQKPFSTSVANTSENCWMPIILKLSPSMASVGPSAVTNASVSLSVLNQTSSGPSLNSVPVVTCTAAVPDVSNGRMCSAKIKELSSGRSQTCVTTEESVEHNGCPEKVRKTPTVSSQSNLAAVGTNEKRLSVKLVDIFGHNSSCNIASSVYFNGKQVSSAENLADPLSGQKKTPNLSMKGKSAVNTSASVNNGPSDLPIITKGSPHSNKVLDESRIRNTSKTQKDILIEDCSSQKRKKFKTGANSVLGNFVVKRCSEETKVNSGPVENTGCKNKDGSMDIGDGEASDRVCDSKHCEQKGFSEPQTVGCNTLAEEDAVTLSSESSDDEVPLVGLAEHGKAKKFKTSGEMQSGSFASPNENRQRSISERTPELSRLLSTKCSPVTFQLKPLDFGMDSQIRKKNINSEQDDSSNVPQKNSKRGRKRICSMPKIQLLSSTHKRQKVVVKKTMSMNRKVRKRQLKSTFMIGTDGIKIGHIDEKKNVASTEPFVCLNTIPLLPNGQVKTNTSCLGTLSQSSSFLSCSKESSGVSVTLSPVLLSSNSSPCTVISSLSKDNKGDGSKKEIGKCPLEMSGFKPDQPLQTLEPVQFGNFRKILPKPRTRPLMFLTFPEQNKTASNNAKDVKGNNGKTK